jgi:hypothetical protein
MSKVAALQFHILDLNVLAGACSRLGLELVHGQQQYKWFGNRGQQEAVPEGFTREELGTCEHAIRIPNNPNAYEIGIVTRRDGQPGYTLLWDSWQGGYGLTDAIGKDGSRLFQQYSLGITLQQLATDNLCVLEQSADAQGNIHLTVGAQGA